MKDDALTEAEAEELFNTGILRRDLTALGEKEVRSKLNRGEYGQPGASTFAAVAAWIADAEYARFELDALRRDRRERITLMMAVLANIIAVIAIITTILK